MSKLVVGVARCLACMLAASRSRRLPNPCSLSPHRSRRSPRMRSRRWQPPVGRSRHPPSWGRTPAPPPLWEPTPGRGAATLNAAVKLSIPAKGRYHGQTHACRSGLACDAGRLHAGRPTDPTSSVIDPRGQRNPDSLSIPAAAQLDAGLNTFTHARPLRSTRAPPFSKWSLDRSPQPRCW